MLKRPFVILLVDDDHRDAMLFTELCHDISPDIDVHHAENGREGLTYLEEGHAGSTLSPRPDLIVLDLNMPVMDGHTFLAEAKQRDHFQLIPIIVLSISNQPGDIQRSYQNHASGYLVKPESFEDMKTLVQVVTSYWRGTMTLPIMSDLGR
ncbi:response regulator [Deinococcus sp. UYEF24]